MKRTILCFLAVLFCIPTYAASNICLNHGFKSTCHFGSFKNTPDKTIYFHCKPPIAAFVKMKNHGVLISGFVGGKGSGSGTLALGGIEMTDVFRTYYFAVQNDAEREGDKLVNIIAGGFVNCKIGKGGRKKQYPGDFG